MAIYLSQHGKAYSKEENSGRALNEIGIAESQQVAEKLNTAGISFAKIFHSGKERAKQTAEVFSNCKFETIEQITGMNPLDDVILFAESIAHDSNYLFVGHLPFMEKLVSYLITGDENRSVIKFQNSCILCIDKINEQWQIQWVIYP